MTDHEFLQQFESHELPFSQWTHRSHVKVAYLHLLRYGGDAATEKIRAGIRAYNAAHGVKDTPTSGYHDTTTVAWLRIVAATLQQYGPCATADEFIDAQPQLTQKNILRLFYSAARMNSPEARREFVEPDLTALPSSIQSPKA